MNKSNKQFLVYVCRFVLAFCLLYYGTTAYIGITVPGGYHSPTIEKYFNYPAWLRASVLEGAKLSLLPFGYEASRPDQYLLRLSNGQAIRMVYSCIGYGVMSFWIAFVFANKGTAKRKIVWMLTGLIALWLTNILRVSLLLVINSKEKSAPFGVDHHTWFNIIAYGLIFIMIYLYDRSLSNHNLVVKRKSFSY